MKKLCWASDYWEVGNAFGYSLHNKMMKQHTGKFLELSNDADVAITIQPADKFKPVQGKYNFLFSMFEATAVPESYLRGFDFADELVVPCRFVKDLFRRYTSKPISVCYEGVDGDLFSYRERNFQAGQKFRILWVGAPNPRKGYPIAIELIRVLEKYPEIEFYLKTTVPKVEYGEAMKQKAGEMLTDETLKEKETERKRLTKLALGEVKPLHGLLETWGENKNIIFDSRTLSSEELVELYHSAHCFIFPSTGEGWGLTLCEAMATGLPTISPIHTAMVDYYSDDVGFPVGWKIEEGNFENYNLHAGMHIPDSNQFLQRIIQVHNNYPLAVRKARRAADLMRRKFTWENAGKRLSEIVAPAIERLKKRELANV